MKTLRVFLKEQLEARQYDGLINDGLNCVCFINDLARCERPELDKCLAVRWQTDVEGADS